MKKITVWSRYHPRLKKWEHNHIEEGWQTGDAPIPSSKLQERMWLNAKWKKEHRLLMDGKIVKNYILKE